MSGRIGTIVSLDPIDALGWIELDEGGRVRFGGTSLKGFHPPPGVGTRVEVRGTVPGYKGVIKAVEVVPVVVPVAATPEVASPPAAPSAPKIPWPDFVRDHPRWSDAAETCVPCARPAPRLEVAPHPLFDPWSSQIAETTPVGVNLFVPPYRKPDPLPDPGPGDTFAHGRIAFLDEPRWPTCGVCSRPLEMCIQIAPAVLADFLPGDRGLVALFCFHCGVFKRTDPRVAHVRLVEPRHRVVGPEAWQSASSGWLQASQRVTPQPPSALVPSSSWHRCRSEVVPGTAAADLLGFDDPPVTGPFPPGVDPDDLGADYDDWIADLPGGGTAYLGGVAHWDQVDETPRCDHGERLHLLDYNGGQFLDGALHVFTCREGVCPIAFVAEF